MQRDSNRRYIERHVAQGLCGSCNEPIEYKEGLVNNLCKKHRLAHNESSRTYRQRLREVQKWETGFDRTATRSGLIILPKPVTPRPRFI